MRHEPYPKGLVIATKAGLTRQGPDRWRPDGRPEYLRQEAEKSLKNLRLDRIDLYQLHRIDPRVPVEESLGALKDLQAEGKVRHIGLSEVSPEEIERARKTVAIVSVQNRYNLLDRAHEPTLDTAKSIGWVSFPGFRWRRANWRKAAGRWRNWRNGTALRWRRSRSRGCCTDRRSCCPFRELRR